MKKGSRKINKEKVDQVFSWIYGLITAMILVFILLALHAAFSEVVGGIGLYLCLSYLFLSFSRAFLALRSLIVTKDRMLTFIKNIVFAALFLIGSIISLAVPSGHVLYTILAFIYFGAIIANRVLFAIHAKKVGVRIFNIFLTCLAAFVLIIFVSASGPESENDQLMTLLLTITIVSFVDVLAFAFAKMQLKGLFRIIRKTYVLEILYGLIILIVSFSFYFNITEENIKSFADGLWYCFAVVTTIGFGDLTVTGPIGRVLSVILGLYGIIVTASITSVIVNYYSEAKGGDSKPAAPAAPEAPSSEPQPEGEKPAQEESHDDDQGPLEI